MPNFYARGDLAGGITVSRSPGSAGFRLIRVGRHAGCRHEQCGRAPKAKGRSRWGAGRESRRLKALHATYGDEHPAIAMAISNRGLCFKLRGDLDSAEPLYRQSLELRRKLLPANHPDIAMSLNNLASLLRDRGDYSEAETLYREALEVMKTSLPPGHFYHALYRRNLGNCLIKLGRFEEAEREIQSAYDQLSQTKGLPLEHVQATMEAFVKLYDAWNAADANAGASEKANFWRERMTTTSKSSH
ncbi:MAG: tetratricopeptide repeat protein [Planctomycetes bacterium]|nr:tetratricopeptide repeat protein [Planctomycetota bacterium]